MERYQNNLQDQFGNAIPTVLVTVRLVSDGSIATIFSDNIGTGKANPFTNDADGEFFFYAADDRYNIFFTGPITDQKDDVLLQDSLAISPNFRVFADIVTATPPTVEAVTANVEYADLDNTDFLARVGFQGSNAFRIKNLMHGGHVQITAEDAGGVDRFLFTGDPAGPAELYHAGVKRFDTDSDGVTLYSDGNTDAEQRRLEFAHQDGTLRGFLGYNAGAGMILRNAIHGALVGLEGENNAGTLTTLISADPDTTTSIYAAGLLRLQASALGTVQIRSDTNTDAENRLLSFLHNDGTRRAVIGHLASTTLDIRNEIHGGDVIIRGENVGAALRTMIHGDPDGAMNLHYPATDLIRMQMAAAGIAGLRSEGNTDSEARRLVFEHQDGLDRGSVGFFTDDTLVLDNNIHSGDILLRAEDAGGGPVSILLADPDGLTSLYADTDIRLYVSGQAELSLYGTANGSTALYWNGLSKFRTDDHTAADQISGAEVLDAEGNFKPVGLGVVINDATTFDTVATHTPFQQINAHEVIYFVGAGAGTANWDTYASTGSDQTNIPDGAMWIVQNNAATSVLLLRGGSGVTIRFWDGGGAPADADVTVARGGIANVRKVSDTIYDIWGIGVT